MNTKIMGNTKWLLLAVLAIASITLSTTSFAEKTNFSHTGLSIDIGSGAYKSPPCAAGYCMSTVGLASLSGSIQFADDLLVASFGSTGVSYSNPVWTYRESDVSLGLGIVKALGDRVDVNAVVASLSAKSEVCGVLCIITDDTGIGYGAGLTIGLNDLKTFVGRISISSSKYSKATKSTETTGLGLGYYATKNSEIGISYGTNDAASSTTIGYAYHF